MGNEVGLDLWKLCGFFVDCCSFFYSACFALFLYGTLGLRLFFIWMFGLWFSCSARHEYQRDKQDYRDTWDTRVKHRLLITTQTIVRWCAQILVLNRFVLHCFLYGSWFLMLMFSWMFGLWCSCSARHEHQWIFCFRLKGRTGQPGRIGHTSQTWGIGHHSNYSLLMSTECGVLPLS